MDLPEQEENVPLGDDHRTSYSTLKGVPLHSLASKEDHNQPHHQPNYSRPAAAVARYRECLKNHAASFGGNATDGCGEFMPGGADGTLEALRCSACGCHRNFHRKDVEGEPPSSSLDHYLHFHGFIMPRPVAVAPPLPPPPDHHVGRVSVAMPEAGKKRLRTKFTAEQKERMLGFAEKVGWRMQGQEEGVVQQFCEEIGVKRRVLKVWMHNNKHNFANKPNSITNNE